MKQNQFHPQADTPLLSSFSFSQFMWKTEIMCSSYPSL